MLEIVKNTIREFLRMKIVYIGIVVGVLFMLSSYLLATLTINQGDKTIVDFSLTVIELFALLVTLFLGAYMLYNEFTKKTILLILSRITKKSHFIIGKFIGFAIILFIVYVLLSLAFVVTLYIHNIAFHTYYFEAIFLSYMKILVVLSFVIFFSTFVSPFLSLLTSMFIYFVSHSTAFIYFFATHDKEKHFTGFTLQIIKSIYYIFPNFQDLSMKEYFLSPNLGAYTNLHFILSTVLGALAYIVVLLILSTIIFNKKEF